MPSSPVLNQNPLPSESQTSPKRESRRYGRWAIVIVFLLFLPFLSFIFLLRPGLIQNKLSEQLREYVRDDFQLSSKQIPKSVQFEENIVENGEGCGALCQRLLYGGSVERVLIKRQYDKHTKAYRLQHMSTCSPSPFPLSQNAQNESEIEIINERRANGDCLIEEVDDVSVPELQISYSNPVNRSLAEFHGMTHEQADFNEHFSAMTIDIVESYVFSEKMGSTTRDVLRKTWASGQAIAMPLHWRFTLCLDSCGGEKDDQWRVVRVRKETGPHLSIYSLLETQYPGMQVEPQRVPLQEKAGLVDDLLTQGLQRYLSQEEESVIDRALVPIVKKDVFSKDDIDFIRRVIRTDGVTNSRGVNQLWIRSTDWHYANKYSDEFAQDALTVLSRGTIHAYGTKDSDLAIYLSNTSSEFLRKHAEEVEALILKYPGYSLMSRLPDFSTKAEQILTELLQSRSADTKVNAAWALCRLDVQNVPEVSKALISVIKESSLPSNLAQTRITTSGVSRTFQDSGYQIGIDGYGLVARTLTRMGYKDAALQAVRAKEWPDALETSERMVNGLSEGFDKKYCTR